MKVNIYDMEYGVYLRNKLTYNLLLCMSLLILNCIFVLAILHCSKVSVVLALKGHFALQCFMFFFFFALICLVLLFPEIYSNNSMDLAVFYIEK